MKFTDSDERGYREEVKLFADWCGTNNLVLKVKKTKEMMHAAHQWESCGDCCTCPGTCTPRPSWQRLKRAHLKSVHPDHFLQGHHRKCPHQQHQLSLVCSFYREKDAEESGEDSWADYWDNSTNHWGAGPWKISDKMQKVSSKTSTHPGHRLSSLLFTVLRTKTVKQLQPNQNSKLNNHFPNRTIL